jgi:hypothetical protein
MKVTVGRVYQTREGKLVRITAASKDRQEHDCYVGLVLIARRHMIWRTDGTWIGPEIPTTWDLVREIKWD